MSVWGLLSASTHVAGGKSNSDNYNQNWNLGFRGEDELDVKNEGVRFLRLFETQPWKHLLIRAEDQGHFLI